MRIRIEVCIKNKEDIESALKRINGKAKKYCFTTYEQIFELLVDAERRLRFKFFHPDLLAEPAVNGLQYRCVSWSKKPLSLWHRYRPPLVTFVILEYCEGSWYVVCIETHRSRAGQAVRSFTFTDAQNDILYKKEANYENQKSA